MLITLLSDHRHLAKGRTIMVLVGGRRALVVDVVVAGVLATEAAVPGLITRGIKREIINGMGRAFLFGLENLCSFLVTERGSAIPPRTCAIESSL